MTKSILIVDDDDSIRCNYEDALIGLGYRVAAYNSAQDSTHNFIGSNFDLAIIDISINGDRSAGHKICKSLKTQYPNLPVVMLTSIDNELNRIIAKENGADGYWIKSACMDSFLEDVNSVLTR